jgi:hypothetical protein
MSNQDEIERIRRLRERQLKQRDPKAKDNAVQHRIAQRYKPKKLTAADVIRDIPGKWLGTIFGALFGIIVAVAINLLVDFPASWMEYVLYFLVLVCAVMGRGLGAAMDWRDEDHDALVKRG